MTKINIAYLGNEHSTWLRSLNFHKTELLILRLIFTEMVGKHTDKQVTTEMEQHEQILREHIDSVDTLRQLIQKRTEALQEGNELQSTGREIAAGHPSLAAEVERTEDTVRDITRQLRKYAAQWM